jgi:Family of unknown function (DUF6527)
MKVVHRIERKGPNDPEFAFFCPGCECGHWFKTTGVEPRWQWNGNFDRPTIKPSIRVRGIVLCHSYVTDGRIQFLLDSTHKLAGQTVDLEEF